MLSSIIAGEKIKEGRKITVINPSNGKPEFEVLGVSSVEEVKEAIDVAEESFEKFSKKAIKDRAKIAKRVAEELRKRIEEFSQVLAKEAGKPIRDARVEVLRAASVFEVAAEEVKLLLEGSVHRVDAYDYPPGNENRMVLELKEPLGVVAAILPFNFPLNSFAHKVAPNLVVGNAVIVKPSSLTPVSAIKLGELLYESGLDKGALSVVVGDSKLIGDELTSNEKVAGITFTGSTEVGMSIARKAFSKRLMMEMGGSDPFIIFEDADLDKAVRDAVRARFEHAGQNCNAGKRFIVHEKVYDSFIQKFVELAKKLVVGDALSETTDVGPVINEEAVEKSESFVEDALAKGAKVLAGGRRIQREGFFFEPTVLKDAPLDSKPMKEEAFFPVAPFYKFKTAEEAIEVANSTVYGLQASIYTKDLRLAIKLSKELKFGGLMINETTRLRWDALPFGGVKMSGLGEREGVRATALYFTEKKILDIGDVF